MKISLVVLSTGKLEGKAIPVVERMVIGRDPGCHLRPASGLISKRHCEVSVHDGKAWVKDFGSANGTFVNDERVTTERELHDAEVLKVGPLAFRVQLEAAPARAAEPASDDEAAAALLLDGNDDPVPAGSTIMMAPPHLVNEETKPAAPAAKPGATRNLPADTSAAAKALLSKYQRRPRG